MSGPPPTYPHDYAVLVAGDVKPVIVTLKAEGIEPGIHHHACGFHRLLARKFPFAIYYDIEGKEARVWAVVDCRRDPVVDYPNAFEPPKTKVQIVESSIGDRVRMRIDRAVVERLRWHADALR